MEIDSHRNAQTECKRRPNFVPRTELGDDEFRTGFFLQKDLDLFPRQVCVRTSAKRSTMNKKFRGGNPDGRGNGSPRGEGGCW